MTENTRTVVLFLSAVPNNLPDTAPNGEADSAEIPF